MLNYQRVCPVFVDRFWGCFGRSFALMVLKPIASCNAKLVLAALANYSQNLTVPERTWRQKAWKWSSSLETEMKTPSRNTSMSSHGWQWTSMLRSRCFVPSQTSQKAKHQQLMWPRRPCRIWTRPSKSRASQVSSSWMLMANSSLRTEGRRFPKTPRVKTCHGHLAWLCVGSVGSLLGNQRIVECRFDMLWTVGHGSNLWYLCSPQHVSCYFGRYWFLPPNITSTPENNRLSGEHMGKFNIWQDHNIVALGTKHDLNLPGRGEPAEIHFDFPMPARFANGTPEQP